MTTAILAEAGLQPTGFVGGRVPGWESGLRIGGNDLFVVEADEYDRSFLTLRPDRGGRDDSRSRSPRHLRLRRAVSRKRSSSSSAWCRPMTAARRLQRRRRRAQRCCRDVRRRARQSRYGIERGRAVRAVGIEMRGRGSRFRVQHRGEELGEVAAAACRATTTCATHWRAIAAALHVGRDRSRRAQRALGRFARRRPPLPGAWPRRQASPSSTTTRTTRPRSARPCRRRARAYRGHASGRGVPAAPVLADA